MAGRYFNKEVLPFTAMVAVECTNVGLNTLFKAATLKGMNYYVFIFYTYAISTLVLLPFPFIFLRKSVLPPLKVSIICRIFLLAMLGLSAKMIGYKGIEYSSPTLASVISNLSAAFIFILAIFFRMEKLTLRSWRTRAKILGTIVSISGALIVVLCKGPTILSTTSPTPTISFHQSFSSSQQTNWAIGGLLLAIQYLMLSFWYIFQTQIMKMYPVELMVVLMYNLSVAIIAAPVCLISERHLSSWILRYDIATIAIIYSGIFGPFSIGVHSWGLRLKGPVYVAIFRPVSIVIAAAMGVMFLGDSLTIGSAVGSIILSVGFYAVIWGKAREDDMREEHEVKSIGSPSSFSSKTPLLQSQNGKETNDVPPNSNKLYIWWNIFQAHIMRMYPAELIVSLLYTLTVAILSAPICFLSERHPSSWRLRSDITTVTIIFAGFFGPAYSTVLHSWGIRLKGPVYIASFSPLSIAVAAAMGFVFLGDALTVGSVVGGLTISVGFYAVLWGKARDEEHGFGGIRSSSPSSKTTPLLQSQNYK